MSLISKNMSFHSADYDYSICLLEITCSKTSVQENININLFRDGAPGVCWMCTAAPKENPHNLGAYTLKMEAPDLRFCKITASITSNLTP